VSSLESSTWVKLPDGTDSGDLHVSLGLDLDSVLYEDRSCCCDDRRRHRSKFLSLSQGKEGLRNTSLFTTSWPIKESVSPFNFVLLVAVFVAVKAFVILIRRLGDSGLPAWLLFLAFWISP